MLDKIMEDYEQSRTSDELLKDIQVEERKPWNFVAIEYNYNHMNKKCHMF